MRRLNDIRALAALFCFMGLSAMAQTPDSVPAEPAKPLSAQERYEQFKKKSKKDYQDFRAKANSEYADFMEKAWRSYNLDAPVPKPMREEFDPVQYFDDPYETADFCHEGDAVVFVPMLPPKPQPLPLSIIEPFAWEDQDTVRFTFYGTDMGVRFGDKQVFKLPNLDKKSIADAWRVMAGNRYNNTINDCLELRKRHSLNDWAYLLMVHQFADKALGPGNEARMLAAFLFTQSGYKTRIIKTHGTAQPMISMLYGTEYLIYDKPAMKEGNIYFYPVLDEIGAIEYVDYPFPKEQDMSLELLDEPSFTKSPTPVRKLHSTRFPSLKAEVAVDGNLITFFDGYPVYRKGEDFMTKWAHYANTPLDPTVRRQLYPQIKPLLDEGNKRQSVEMLLDFVQSSFPYAYDSKVWGYDRAFFAEESLYYPGSDCEDHAIIFSRLVRDLLDLDVLLVFMPGHLLTAVDMGEDVHGEAVRVDGKRYTICDPTWVGHPAGMTYKYLDRSKMKVIKLNKK